VVAATVAFATAATPAVGGGERGGEEDVARAPPQARAGPEAHARAGAGSSGDSMVETHARPPPGVAQQVPHVAPVKLASKISSLAVCWIVA